MRFKDTDIFQDVFDEIVLQAMNHRMVGGRVLFTDSTHLKANANKKKFSKQEVHVETADYMEELDEAVLQDRQDHGKKPLKEKKKVNQTREIKISEAGPESGYFYRENKPEGFFYLDHRTTDLKYNIGITNQIPNDVRNVRSSHSVHKIKSIRKPSHVMFGRMIKTRFA